MKGVAQSFEKRFPNRPKVKVKLEGGLDVKAQLGKVIFASGDDKEDDKDDQKGKRGRRGASPDWSRYKGKTDAECLQEFKERHKDSAVTSHGKSYAKRPLNFDASMASTALANPAAEAGVHFSQSSLKRQRQTEEDEALEDARLAPKRQEEDE